MMLIGIIILIFIVYLIYSGSPREYRHSIGNKDAKCYSCGHGIQEDFIYCPQCSIPLKEKCKGCGKYINTDWRSCPYCNDQRLG
ncbi:zinc ribbon domain-containing protein [Anaerosolibacter carboniphilus]|nr:zinc ribbon domain-containing protein [Anaerosolibacter carboniphilus]